MTQRYPLAWPAGWPRTPPLRRIRAKFSKGAVVQRAPEYGGAYTQQKPLTVAQAIDRVMLELDRLGVQFGDVLISSNLELRLDGFPRSGQAMPADPGIAVYWNSRAGARVMASDRYDRIADNLAAIAATLEAMRSIERHGGAQILERAFTGFDALPAPVVDWRRILDLQHSCTRAEIQQRFRELAAKYHPDLPGGSHERMVEISRAREEGLKECQI